MWRMRCITFWTCGPAIPPIGVWAWGRPLPRSSKAAALTPSNRRRSYPCVTGISSRSITIRSILPRSIRCSISAKALGNSNSIPARSANPDFGRRASDSPALRGLGNIGVSVEFGGYMSVRVGPIKLDAEMSQDVADGHHGADLDLHSSLVVYRDKRLTLAPDIVVTWVTARYMKSFFGITQTQSNDVRGCRCSAPGRASRMPRSVCLESMSCRPIGRCWPTPATSACWAMRPQAR